MAKHLWSVLCYKGILDQYTNQVSLLDVIEGITATAQEPPRPLEEGKALRVPASFMLVSLWMRSDVGAPEEITTRVRLVAPTGVSRRPNVVKVDLTKHVRSRTFMRFEGLPYHGDGYYQFIVEVQGEQADQWRVVAEVPLEFKLEYATPPAEAAAVTSEKPEKPEAG
jgi:hypothetical protein